jgi:hypothetical protein
VSDIRDTLSALKQRLEAEPAVPLETAAELCNLSTRTIRRRIHRFEVRRDRRNHILVSLRSIKRFIESEQYQPSLDFDARKSVK